jgi:hypothetical protein
LPLNKASDFLANEFDSPDVRMAPPFYDKAKAYHPSTRLPQHHKTPEGTGLSHKRRHYQGESADRFGIFRPKPPDQQSRAIARALASVHRVEAIEVQVIDELIGQSVSLDIVVKAI